MGLLAEFDVVNDYGFIPYTPEYGIVPDYEPGCQVFVETFLEVATDLVPVDTGYLRSSLDADTDGTYCYAIAECEYAEYVEFGTWKQGAQPYFRPALIAAIQEAAPYWEEAQEEALMEEEELKAMEEEEGDDASLRGVGLLGGLLGFLAGIVIMAVVTIVETFIKDTLGLNRGNGGFAYMPEVIII